MATPPERTDLAVERWGAGPPVLLLHGIGGSGRYWQPLAEVCDGFRATAPDLLGFGRSPWPEDSAYDVDAHLERLIPLVVPGSVVVAHSTGAILAGALAVARPDLVRSLLLVSAPLYRDERAARRQVRKLGLLARVTVAGEIRGRLAMVLLHTLVQPLSKVVPLPLPDAVVEDFWKHSWTSYSRTLRRVVVGHPLLPDLLEVRVPTVLLYGADDSTATREPLAELLRANPCVRHLEVGGTHQLPVRRPEVVADLLREVLSG